MKSVLKPVLVALAFAVAGLAHAAPPTTGNGYFGSVTWYTGWGNPLVTHTVGPYLTYGDCYTAWMALAHSNPQWFVERVQPCTLHATHQTLMHMQFSISLGGPENPIGSAEDVRRLGEQILRIRREFKADAYEEALQKVR